MDKDLEEYITVIALGTLVETYTSALDSEILKLNEEEKELAEYIIQNAKELLEKYSAKLNNPIIQRPQWKP